jgi:hypothetical protein
MRKLPLFLLCAVGAANASAMDFDGFVSSWKQDCTNGCALPVPSESGPASFKIDVPMNPGEARTAKFERTFSFETGEKVKASFTMFFVCPRDERPRPGEDSCPSRYLQVQAVLTGDARAFCAASLNTADAHPFPVMMCAGENLRRAGERLGVSLSRKSVTPN